MCFSPNILLEPVSPGNKSRKIPEHLAVKHCTLTPHVKAADFTSLIFWHAALLRTECVALQRDAATNCSKNNETNLPSMLLGWVAKGAA
jgi:hypothetical protein